MDTLNEAEAEIQRAVECACYTAVMGAGRQAGRQAGSFRYSSIAWSVQPWVEAQLPRH